MCDKKLKISLFLNKFSFLKKGQKKQKVKSFFFFFFAKQIYIKMLIFVVYIELYIAI